MSEEQTSANGRTGKELARSIAFMAAGTVFMAFSYVVFLVPEKIAGGGFAGIAAIVYNKTGFPAGVLTYLMNIPLYIVAFRSVGKRFFLLSVIGLTMYSVFIELSFLIEADVLQFLGLNGEGAHDVLLNALFGGALSGCGLGLIMREGGSTGGSDLLANLIHSKSPQIKVGRVILILDVVVIIANAIVFADFKLALYATLMVYVAAKFVDFVVDGFRECKAFYIITDKYEEIASAVMTKIKRGATSLSARGMYTKAERNMLLILVTRVQQRELRNIIYKIDPAAFIFSVSAKEVLGEGFNPVKP